MPPFSRIAVASLAASLPYASSYAVGAPASSDAVAVAAAARSPPPLAVADLIKPTLAILGGGGDKKEAIGDTLPDCPSTIWAADDLVGDEIDKWQAQYKSEDIPLCPVEVHATPEANAAGMDYFIERREEFAELLAKHGTIWFRGFDLTKDTEGFRSWWEALQLDPCLDPIHSSGLRKFLSKRDALYEEVNKQSLAKHFIGLHNEATFKKTATTGAFVCFKPATVFGGEFFIADGERILRDLDPAVRTPTPTLTRTRTRTRTLTSTPTSTPTLTLTLSLSRCSRSCTRRRCASRRSTSTWTCWATCRAG